MDENRTSNGRYLVKDVMRLAQDPVFNARFSSDRVLAELMNPTPEEDRSAEEVSQSLGFTRRIMGVDVPPATLGGFVLLALAGNECVKERPDWSKGFDFQLRQLTEALFVLRFRSEAVTAFTPVFRMKRTVEEWRGKVKDNPALLAPLLEAERKVADDLAKWDAAVLRFAERFIKIEPDCNYQDEGNALLDHLLRAMDGFGLFPAPTATPEPNTAEKKTFRYGTLNLRLRLSRGLVRLAHRLLRTRSCGRSR